MRAPDILRVFVTTDSPSKELSVKAYNVNRSCPKHYTGYKAVSRFDLIERSSWHTVPGTEKKLKNKKKFKETVIQCGVCSRSLFLFPLSGRKEKASFFLTHLKLHDYHNSPFPWLTSENIEPSCHELFLPDCCADKQLPFTSPKNEVECNRRFWSRCTHGISCASAAVASVLPGTTAKQRKIKLKPHPHV